MQPMHNIPARGGIDYDESPFLAIWEVTQSCDLACKHCRAAAQPIPHPDELTHAEGKALIDQIAAMHIPIFVFTGGDPLKRKDVFELIRYAAEQRRAGCGHSQRHAAAHPRSHLQDERGRPGAARHLARRLDPRDSRRLSRPARRMGAHHPGHRVGQRSRHSHPGAHHHQPPQRATTSTTSATCSRSSPSSCGTSSSWFPWAAASSTICSPARSSSRSSARSTSSRGAPTSRSRPPKPCTTAATCCSTIWKSGRWEHGARPSARAPRTNPGPPRTGLRPWAYRAPTADAETRTAWATRRVNDGKGFMFISHVGNVYPSGFLPIHAGNIRETPLADIYRNAPIFKALRDTSRLEGKCGACEFKEICGGSRARAYALTGDPLAQEPCCIYQPRNWDPLLEQRGRSLPRSRAVWNAGFDLTKFRATPMAWAARTHNTRGSQFPRQTCEHLRFRLPYLSGTG